MYSIADLRQNKQDCVFVAMDFSPRYQHVYDELIEPAVLSCGMTPIRSDRIASAGGIVFDEILDVMKISQTVIADITGLNPNVMIEVGMAHTLGKNLILMTQDKSVPFDVQSKRVIFYNPSRTGQETALELLATSLKSTVFPKDALLRKMLWHGMVEEPLSIIYGTPTLAHLENVFPIPTVAYADRLNRRSSSSSGIWHIGLALQRIAWSAGADMPNVVAIDSARAPLEAASMGNVILIGGPGANSHVARLNDVMAKTYSDAVYIAGTQISSGKTRYLITRSGAPWPSGQDELLASGTDFALVTRIPNPYKDGSTMWSVAGIRSYGTEAAIRVLTSPLLVREITQRLAIDEENLPFWALFAAKFSEEDQNLHEVDFVDCGKLEVLI